MILRSYRASSQSVLSGWSKKLADRGLTLTRLIFEKISQPSAVILL